MKTIIKLKPYIQLFMCLCCVSNSVIAKDNAYDNLVHKDSVVMIDAENTKSNNPLTSNKSTTTYNADDNC